MVKYVKCSSAIGRGFESLARMLYCALLHCQASELALESHAQEQPHPFDGDATTSSPPIEIAESRGASTPDNSLAPADSNSELAESVPPESDTGNLLRTDHDDSLTQDESEGGQIFDFVDEQAEHVIEAAREIADTSSPVPEGSDPHALSETTDDVLSPEVAAEVSASNPDDAAGTADPESSAAPHHHEPHTIPDASTRLEGDSDAAVGADAASADHDDEQDVDSSSGQLEQFDDEGDSTDGSHIPLGLESDIDAATGQIASAPSSMAQTSDDNDESLSENGDSDDLTDESQLPLGLESDIDSTTGMVRSHHASDGEGTEEELGLGTVMDFDEVCIMPTVRQRRCHLLTLITLYLQASRIIDEAVRTQHELEEMLDGVDGDETQTF